MAALNRHPENHSCPKSIEYSRVLKIKYFKDKLINKKTFLTNKPHILYEATLKLKRRNV